MPLNKQIETIKDQLKKLDKDKQALKQQRLQTSKRAARSNIRSSLKIINQYIKDYTSSLKQLERHFRHDSKRIKVFKRDCDTRHQFAKSLPDFIQNNRDTHEPFFVTLRFTNPHEKTKKEQYPKFIKSLCEQLDRKLSCKTDQTSIKPFLIAIPEEQPMFHYHAVMMIPKITSDQFMNKCVIDIVPEYIEELKKIKDTYILKTSILKAHCLRKTKYNKVHTSSEQPNKIKVSDYQICKLEEDFERYAISNYIMKSFINSPTLEYNDILIECRDRQNI